jgi:uncharacterized protein (TIGR02271 family)
MSSSGSIPVFGPGGRLGAIDAAPEGQGRVTLRLDNGTALLVPGEVLEPRNDGAYYLPFDPSAVDAAPAHQYQESVIPVVEESLEVHKRPVEQGRVRVRKTVQEHEEQIDEPLLQEDVEVERVKIDQVVEKVVPAHYEGDTLVIPLMEEVLVIEKRLIVREELRITRRRLQVRESRRVTLRSEEATVERLPGREPAAGPPTGDDDKT